MLKKLAALKLTRSRKMALCSAGMLFLIVGGYSSYLAATDNFHTVVPGEVYRSSQPSAETIADIEKRYGIKTILNLRGDSGKPQWYDEEVAQAKALGITHIDFGMSAAKQLTQEKAEALIRIMRDAPKPILIHCRSGADRTGLASALYLAAIAKTSEKTAEGQMSILYGHLGLPLSAAFAMDRTFEMMEPVLGFPDS
ncbi:dual specificity protein phosphatase family protein [Rhizobium sp. 18055]|uniref:dual specificity protein phosphatase family protein n=1 Tax=Rhizobium sp. 18055 TaxID=2681403 RepID=UPI00135911C4|nr:dual specificity protein phosphatase family protein [Rhizobium sp. 18055]